MLMASFSHHTPFKGPIRTLVSERRVGDDAVCWAGAVVTTDVEAEATVAGVPARPVQVRRS